MRCGKLSARRGSAGPLLEKCDEAEDDASLSRSMKRQTRGPRAADVRIVERIHRCCR